MAAVKRARHVNTLTSEFMPQQGVATSVHTRQRPPRSSPGARSTRWSWLPTNPASWPLVIAFGLFGAAVVGTAYLAVEESADHGLKGRVTPAALDPPAADASAARSHVAGAPDSAQDDAPAKSPESAEVAPADGPPPAVQSLEATLPQKPATRKAPIENRKRLPARTNPPHSSEVSDEAKTMIVLPEPDPAAPSPPVPQPAAPDRWETMNAALAECSRETFFAGVVCTERVRYQYCEGFWGQVPQCRAATPPGSAR